MTESPDTAERLERVYDMLEEELDSGAPHLDGEEAVAFRQYYGRLLTRPRKRPFYRYNWTTRLAPAAGVLAGIVREHGSANVLDAGCGCGTESFLWASLAPQVRVVGADARRDRLAAASRRLAHCARALGDLSIDFRHEDVFTLLDPGAYDLVWVMEAISHITPADEFVRRAAGALRLGGCLAISDSNLLNPMMAAKVAALRLRGAKHTTLMTESGGTVQSAPEHLLSPAAIRRLMENAGLEVTAARLRVFFPPAAATCRWLFPLLRAWDRFAGAVPGLRAFGGIYTIIARKV